MLTFLSPAVLFWVAALIIFLVVEAATVGLVSIWFAGGALAGLIAAALGAPIWLQALLFLAVSAILLALLRPFVQGLIAPAKTATNADRHLGKSALVTEEINNLLETGSVKLDGVIWTARSMDNTVIPVGETIVVHHIEGVKLIVQCPKAAVSEAT